MSRSGLKLTYSGQTQLKVSGVIHDDGTITYSDEYGVPTFYNVGDFLKYFAGEEITLTITQKSEDNLLPVWGDS